MPRVYAIGQITYDITFMQGKVTSSSVGGSVVNSAISLARLGAGVSLISDCGKDALGDDAVRVLTGEGIDCSLIDRRSNPRTSIAIAHIDTQGDASYTFYRDNNPIEVVEAPCFKSGDIVLFSSSYSVDSAKRDNLLHLLKSARAKGATIYYDPNVRDKNKALLQMDSYMENIALSHVVRGSDEDFANIFGIESPTQLLPLLKDKHILYTQKQGTNCYMHHDKSIKVATKRVDVVNTIGAGDNFNAGFIYSLLEAQAQCNNLDQLSCSLIERALKQATTISSHVCGRSKSYISREFGNAFGHKCKI